MPFYLQVFFPFLQEFHFSFNSHKSELFRWSIAIVEVEFISRLNVPFGKNPNPMVPIHTQNLSATVWIDGVISKSYFVSFPSCIHHKFIVEIEEEGTHVLIINLPSSVCFLLRDYLATIFRNEFILGSELLDEDPPSCHIRWSHEELLPHGSLDHHVLARDFGAIILISSTGCAEIGVTLSNSQETRALLGGALGFAATSWEPVLTVSGAETELFTKVSTLNTATRWITSLARMMAWMVIVDGIDTVVFL